MQSYVNLVDLEKCGKMTIWSQNLASIQPRTSPSKFDLHGRVAGLGRVHRENTQNSTADKMNSMLAVEYLVNVLVFFISVFLYMNNSVGKIPTQDIVKYMK